MSKKKNSTGFYVSACLFIVFWTISWVVIALGVKEELDEQSLTDNGGLAYGVCFLVAGLSLTALAIYSCYLHARGWDTVKFFRALKVAVSVAGGAAVVCTIWFIIYPGYMNPGGLLGLAVSLTTWWWVVTTSNEVLRHSKQEHHQPVDRSSQDETLSRT